MSAEEQAEQDDQRPLVIVIDDEPPVCRTVARALKERYRVRSYETAEDFEPPDEPHVLIVDKNLPGISGLDLVERQQQRAEVPFETIMITGYADMESALRAMQIGVFKYLRKPFDVDDLLASVGGAAERLADDDPPRADQAPLLARVRELEGTVSDLSLTLSSLRRNETALLNERLVSLGQVTASVTHELNNVLTYVMGNFELLSQRLPAMLVAVETLRAGGSAELFFEQHGSLLQGALYEGLPTFMKQTGDGLELIRQLCEDLRGLSKVSDQAKVFDVREAAQTAIRMAGAVVRRNIELSVTMDDNALPARGNAGRLVQAMINLLINAAEAIDPKQDRPRRIKLELTRADSRVLIRVTDTGRGIQKKYLQDIFKPFVTFKKDGTGLGLPLVQSIVEQAHGELTISSEVDQGTTVDLHLPLALEDWPRTASGRITLPPEYSDDKDRGGDG